MNIIVTGGAGFIGSAFIRHVIGRGNHSVLNIDKLTYAGDLRTVASVSDNPRYRFEKLDICEEAPLKELFRSFQLDAVVHLAAESHVDRSIDGPAEFIRTNIVGTYTLLEVSREYWGASKRPFRFQHVSTDEVFGSLGPKGLFTEQSPYQPNSPYSASKASSDHLVRAWHHTYGLPVVLTNCSNNYGPYQFPEKFIPLLISKALRYEPMPIYGQGQNIRDWLYVEDHASALLTVLEKAAIGTTYNIGGESERKNIDVANQICDILDELRPSPKGSLRKLIQFVADRPGHDLRYAMDISTIKRELRWKPQESFHTGIKKTVTWYLENQSWLEQSQHSYQGQRLGLRRKHA